LKIENIIGIFGDMRDNIIREKSFLFAVKVVKVNKILIEKQKEYVISRQLLKSGTSVGAMIRESEHAESKADFIHKLSVALKEANESLYWLELLKEAGYLSIKTFEILNTDCEELIKLLVKIVKTLKTKKIK